MLILKLDCGRDVVLDDFFYSRTYSGLLGGGPDHELNEHILEEAKRRVVKVWGPRKTHVIPPAVNDVDPAHPRLPPTLMIAWLYCIDPIDPRRMGSELVVVWFTGECHERPIAEVVFDAIHGLPWQELAEDFDW
jgi:hypothetical protein